MITIQEIKAAGEVPESFYHIAPGCAIYYVPEDGISTHTKQLAIDIIEKCANQREGFALKIEVEPTSHPLLANTFVAKRLNLGSLYRYNLLMASVNCQESVDAFVKEFFDLASRDDAALKYIKREPRPRYRDYDEPSFAPADMALNMIVMRPPHMVNEEEVIERDPEQIKALNAIQQLVLDYADKYKSDVPREILYPLAEGAYILTDDPNDCKLIFTPDDEFFLKAGTTVHLNLTKFQKAFYLFLLAHPEGIVAKRLSEYRDELKHYYELVFKFGGNINEINKTIDTLVDISDPDMPALRTLRSKLNSKLNSCILDRTNQKPFMVQVTDGVLHVDLPRKFFECQDKFIGFRVKD